MDDIYNKEYYEQYDVGVAKVDYANSQYIKTFLTTVASYIVEQLHPKTVLDAGCAMGHLVAALRDLGVEAYGIDISNYAISCVRDDVKPYCAVGSLTDSLPENFPRHFDLVTNIEVMEHLSPEDGAKGIHNLCQLTDRIVFSSSPDDYDEPTHINVQQREYWSEAFAKNGFLRNLDFNGKFISHQAVCFERSENNNIIGLFETKIRQLEEEIECREKVMVDQLHMIQDRDATILKHIAMVQERDKTIQGLTQRIEEMKTIL